MKINQLNFDLAPANCQGCNTPTKPEDLRPYGPNGDWICFDCGMKPENRSIVEETLKDIMGNNDIIVRPEGTFIKIDVKIE